MSESPDPALFFQVHVFVCTNQRPDEDQTPTCGRHGMQELRDHLKKRARELGPGKVAVTATKCLSRCSEGPVVVIYPTGIWYRPTNVADMDEIFETHLKQGGRVERLLVK